MNKNGRTTLISTTGKKDLHMANHYLKVGRLNTHPKGSINQSLMGNHFLSINNNEKNHKYQRRERAWSPRTLWGF